MHTDVFFTYLSKGNDLGGTDKTLTTLQLTFGEKKSDFPSQQQANKSGALAVVQ